MDENFMEAVKELDNDEYTKEPVKNTNTDITSY